jgi:3-oxoacyl-[acyl-carrier protein] reductase
MDLGLKNKVALIAAASRGLGRAVAEELATEGASLVVCSRDTKSITQAAAEIAEKFGERTFWQ